MEEKSKKNYKDTLNLPQTDFPMKANLPEREPQILKFWQDSDIYRLTEEKTKGRPSFVLHDGPPYANGDIHVGTALNKILKDIVVKYHSMTGRHSPYLPGWDCHGQPIEHEVEKKLTAEKKKVSQAELRRLCREYALKFVQRQSRQFQRLGVRGDFKRPYLTLDHAYEATNVWAFSRLYQRGLIYKGRKPIHWCYRCQTALAEAEIEYRDEESPSIYVKFPLKSEFSPLKNYSEPKYILIWTTTPWTLPANVAVAVHPAVEYVAVRLEGQIYVLARPLLKNVVGEVGLKKPEVLAEFKGSELENLLCRQPLQDWDSRVVLASYVATDTGTGCVHIAPGHGQEDFQTGLEYSLPTPMPVDEQGVFTKEAGKFAGSHIKEANQVIIDDLRKQGLLPYATTTTHSYPHCWRCKKEVIFRATEQWFVAMDKGKFREEALRAIEKAHWIPGWSVKRITSMVKERPDWCISRQRSWGVPIPVFYCDKCEKEIVTEETLPAVEELFRKEGADSWFTKKPKEILPAGFRCPHCNSTEFRKEEDILDVWFESGISHFAVLKTRLELQWPADLYLEGSDQHRGWFQSSLLASVGAEREAPYKAVLTHGFVVDGEGRKMSKSLGNVIDPLEVIKKSGADILRLWVASSDYSVDIAISEEILEQMSEAYRRIRNSLRFLLGNLYDFDPKRDRLAYQDLEEIDRWALHSLSKLLQQVTEAYESYRFHLVFHRIYNFCVTEMSAFYFDVLKDRLYTAGKDSKIRRSAQTSLFEILMSLVKILSPLLAFTAEETWQSLPEAYREEISVQLCQWPFPKKEFIDKELEERWGKLLKVRGEVSKTLEMARQSRLIGDSLEAGVVIYASGKIYDFLKGYEDYLKTIFIVSEVELEKDVSLAPPEAFQSEIIRDLRVAVSKASGKKCLRCWNWSPSVGQHPEHKDLCGRCVEVVES